MIYKGKSFTYGRIDNSIIGKITLNEDGTISDYKHPNETYWTINTKGELEFLDINKIVTSCFDNTDNNDISIIRGSYKGKKNHHWLKELPTKPHYIQLIRDAKQEELCDENKLEQLICKCGIANMPYLPSLSKYQNFGLKPQQTPRQLARYLIYLSNKHIETYLEIGVAEFGMFIWTIEFLSRFHRLKRAVAVDINDKSFYKNDYNNDIVETRIFNTCSPEFKNWISNERFDLTFIDANHSEPNVSNDLLLSVGISKYVAMHDTIDFACPDVIRVYNCYKNCYPNNKYYEFFDQTDNVCLIKMNHGISVIEIPEHIKVIKSWDVFDTLLARKCYHPHKIFELVSKRSGVVNFPSIRQKAIEYYNKNNPNHSHDDFFDGIFNSMRFVSDLTDSQAQALRQMELDIERENLFPIMENVACFKENDIVVSDMYLPKYIIFDFLKSNGVNVNFDNIYVSKNGKSRGDIWKTLHKKYSSLMHCGDNEHSDVNMPSKCDIIAKHYVKSKFNSIEALFEKDNFNLSCLLRYVRLSNNYTNIYDNMYYEYIVTIYLPLLAVMKNHVETIAKEIQGVVWLSYRDCEILHKIMLREGNIHNVKPLYISRLCYHAQDDKLSVWWRNNVTNNDVIYDLCGTGYSYNCFINKNPTIPHPRHVKFVTRRPEQESCFPFTFHVNDLLEISGHLNIGTSLGYNDNGSLLSESQYNTRYSDILFHIFDLVNWSIPSATVSEEVGKILFKNESSFVYYKDIFHHIITKHP